MIRMFSHRHSPHGIITQACYPIGNLKTVLWRYGNFLIRARGNTIRPFKGNAMDEVLFYVESGVGRIIINRPEKRNALNHHIIRHFREALQRAAQAPEVRVVTITGAGEKAFCAGGDLKALLLGGRAFGRIDFRKLLLEIVQYPKPTIALVRGHVMGGGLGLVLACDLSLACDDVFFSTPEIQVGMFPMMVMGLLCRNVGRKKATEMMFLGERITAVQALEFGILNHVHPRDQFDAASGDLIQKLLSKSPAILRMGKRAISRLLDERLEVEENHLESALAEVMATDDSKEGLRAFIERRPPKWK
jgi:enoyl-CoA hydratase